MVKVDGLQEKERRLLPATLLGGRGRRKSVWANANGVN